MSLLLGQFDRLGALRHAGQTHPFTATQRRKLAAVLQGMAFQGTESGHPWPCPLPPGWLPGLSDPKPISYAPVEPTLAAEVEIDTRLWVDTPENLVGVVEALGSAVFHGAVANATQRLNGKGNIFQRLDDTAALFIDAGYPICVRWSTLSGGSV